MSAEEYTRYVDDIRRRNPGERLLRTLSQGHSATNEIYLKSALRRLQDAPKVQPTPSEAITPDDKLRALWNERKRLFGEMNKQSNKFHECRTDADRAANSAKVLGWWADIQAVKEKIAYYEKHGELPAATEDGDELPDNPALLAKKLNSLRASVSQHKKKLTDLAGLDPGTPGLQSKIDTAENNLKRLRWLVGRAEQKLKEHEPAA